MPSRPRVRTPRASANSLEIVAALTGSLTVSKSSESLSLITHSNRHAKRNANMNAIHSSILLNRRDILKGLAAVPALSVALLSNHAYA